MKRILTVACLGLLVFLPACASSNGSSGGERRDRSVIERAEIAENNHTNALEAVRSLRPHWLRKRGSLSIRNEPEIAVYFDGVRAGGPDALTQVPVINIQRIRYYDASEAQFKFGVGHGHGAIDVVTRQS